MTKLFWENERHNYDQYVSDYVVEECSRGDCTAAQKRLDALAGIKVLQKTAEIETLTGVYQKLLQIPDRARADCSHLAVCVLEHIDYLLTWNCTHLGPVAQAKIQSYNEGHRLWTPALVTPEDLLPFVPLEEDET
ncbi:MAG: type II toxin-antitoxin system VapC family toxin [Treponema sp.]|jgi:hypothetical protein|nr:type II toxin-antitoxin system VapC family toxin [Treponema sp.]